MCYSAITLLWNLLLSTGIKSSLNCATLHALSVEPNRCIVLFEFHYHWICVFSNIESSLFFRPLFSNDRNEVTEFLKICLCRNHWRGDMNRTGTSSFLNDLEQLEGSVWSFRLGRKELRGRSQKMALESPVRVKVTFDPWHHKTDSYDDRIHFDTKTTILSSLT